MIGLYISIFVVLIVVAALAVQHYSHKGSDKPNNQWEKIRRKKRREIASHISNIQQIHERAIGEGKKIGLLEKKKVLESFQRSVAAFREYVEFCDSKCLALTPDEEKLLSTVDDTADKLEPKKALDNQLERAGNEYNRVYEAVNSSGEHLFSTRQDSVQTIDDIEELVNSIAKHPKAFDKELKEISIERNKFRSAMEFGISEQKALKAAAGSTGAGVAAGAAVASMAPTAAMWVATTFGTASTGTAISALSGAAATNAALAWLGGGALAAGGSGMAAGQALLALAGPVGWGVAGGSALISVLFVWRKKMKIQESKKEEISRLKSCTSSLEKLKADIESIDIQTAELNERLRAQFALCENLHSGDYTTFSDDQTELLGAIVNNTKALSMLVSKILGAEDENDTGKRKRKARKK